MHPARLLEVKQVVRETDIRATREVMHRWLKDPGIPNESTLLQQLDQSQAS
jgi:hypothetical protein